MLQSGSIVGLLSYIGASMIAGVALVAAGYYLARQPYTYENFNRNITREWSDWNNGWYWWIQSIYLNL